MEDLPNNHDLEAENTADAVYEHEIARSTRSFLQSLEQSDQPKPPRNLFIITSVAASFLVLLFSILTINISHSDRAIAKEYGINQVVTRSGENIYESNFTEAVKAYYKQDYPAAQEYLAQVSAEEEGTSDYVDWLELLISLQTDGGKSITFRKKLDEILGNEEHEFFYQAKKMENDLSLFWRNFTFN